MMSRRKAAFLNPCAIQDPVRIKAVKSLEIFVSEDFFRYIVPCPENLYASQTVSLVFGGLELICIHTTAVPGICDCLGLYRIQGGDHFPKLLIRNIVDCSANGKSKSIPELNYDGLKGKKTMNRVHVIKLRGGWKLHLEGSAMPWNFPSTARELIQAGPLLRLSRRFQSPPMHCDSQKTHLKWAKIEGTQELRIDQRVVDLSGEEPIFWAIPDQREAHLIELVVATDRMAVDGEFGEFWLEIFES